MIRTIDFKFIVTRSGVYRSTLQAISDSTPVIQMSDDGEIKTSFTGDFIDPGDSVNWLSDEIRPQMIIDGVAHNLGVFLATSVTPYADDAINGVHIQALDKCWILRDTKTTERIYWALGVKYRTAITQLLSDAGIQMVNFSTENTAGFRTARADWDVGTSYLTIINELLGEINYKNIWFDTDGMAICEKKRQPTLQNVQHVLNKESVTSLMLPTFERSLDIYNKPNVFLCVCPAVGSASAITVTVSNTNPLSPLSIANRGRRIVQVVNVNNTPNSTALTEYANNLLQESLYSQERLTVQTALLSGYGVQDIVALSYDDVDSICTERSWSMELSVGGKMTHNLERVVVNISV